MERRAIIELRTTGRKLEGYAAKFNTPARIANFVEIIQKGAFARIGTHDVSALVDHDPTKLLARTKSGNLKLSEDSQGLAFEINLPETSLAKDLLELSARHELGGMSIGFLIPQGGEHWDGNRRTLTTVDLREISVITGATPAYEGTTVIPRTKTPRLNLALAYLESCKWDS
jgi:uncharacterized protein